MKRLSKLLLVLVLIVRMGRGNPPPPVVLAGGGGNPGAIPPAGGPAPPGWQPVTYTVTLLEDRDNTRVFTFQQGQKVEITVRTSAGLLRVPDVDVFVTRIGDPAWFLADTDESKDCYVQFIAPATDQYTVRVDNLGPGSATSTVTVR